MVEERHGLPLLIDKVVRTFERKDKNVLRWEDGLRHWQRCDNIKIEGMDEVLECLEIFYENLKDNEQKACFLYLEESKIYVNYLLDIGKLKILLIMQKISN